MKDDIGPQGDNPLQQIFNRILGTSQEPSSFKEKVKWLSPDISREGKSLSFASSKSEELYGKPLSRLIAGRDKHNILSNLSSFNEKARVIRGDSTWESLKVTLGNRYEGDLVKLLETLESVSDQGSVIYSKSQNALFYGTPETGFNPIALQSKKSGLVNIGFNSYGASQVTETAFFGKSGSSRFSSFADAYFGSVIDEIQDSGGRLSKAEALSSWRVANVLNNTYSQSVIGATPTFGGRSSVYLGGLRKAPILSRGFKLGESRSFFNFQARVLQTGGRTQGVLSRSASLAKASAAFNIITRTGIVPQGLLNVPSDISGSEALEIASKVKGDYAGHLLKAAGTAGRFLPFVKPEYLLDPKNLNLPVAHTITREFGNIVFPRHLMEKGVFQMRHIRPATARQKKMYGQSVLPSFVYPGEAGRRMARGMSLNIGIVETTNQIADRMLFQESGALITDYGAGVFRSNLPAGQVDITLPDEYAIGALERTLGLNLASDSRVTNKALPFSMREFKRATTSGKKLPFKKLTRREQNIRKALGSSRKSWGAIERALSEGHVINHLKRTVGGVTLSFATGGSALDSSVEMIAGLRRMTGVVTHPLSKIFTGSNPGITMFVSAEEYNKMFHGEVLLENLFTAANRKGYMDEVMSKMGLAVRTSKVSAPSGMIIPEVVDFESAQSTAIAIVKNWKNSKDASRRKLAEDIEHGTDVTSQMSSPMLRALGISKIRTMRVRGGLRADHAEDINPLQPARVTPSKMSLLTSRGRLFGHRTAQDDPVFSLFNRQFRKRTKGYRINYQTGGVDITDRSMVQRFFTGLSGQLPDKARVFGLGEGGFTRKGATYTIPEFDAFTFASGGVKRSALSDSPLSGGITFIDLGKEYNINLSRGSQFESIGDSYSTRYLPVPTDLIRANRALIETEQGTISQTLEGGRGRVIATDLSRDYIRALNYIQSGDIKTGLKYFGRGAFTTSVSLGRRSTGDRGILEHLGTVNERAGFRVRVEPGSNYDRAGFGNLENVFDVHVYEDELEDLVTRRRFKGAKNVRGSFYDQAGNLKKDAFSYALITADPTQRAEHHLLTRMKVLPGRRPGTTTTGKMGIQVHPLILRMLERDADRDVVNLFLLEAMGGDRAKLAAEMKTQQALSSVFLPMFEGELGGQGGVIRSLTALVNEGKVTSIRQAIAATGAYLSQKTQAHLGYTLTRTVDRLLPVIQRADTEAINQLIRPGQNRFADSFIQTARNMYDPTRDAVAQALAQEIKQGGVQKGLDSPIDTLAIQLQKIREEAKNLSPQQAISRATSAFEDFLTSPGGKNREYMAASYIAAKKYGADALPQILEDLKRGSAESIYHAEIRKGAAQLLGERYGLGYALSAFMGTPRSALSVMQDQVGSILETPNKVFSNIIDPLMKRAPMMEGTGPVNIATTADEAVGVWSKLDGLLTKFDLRGGKGVLAGAAAGAVAWSLTDDGGASLPPPTMEIQPTDRMAYSSPWISSPTNKLYTSINSYPQTSVSYDRAQIETFNTQNLMTSSSSSYQITETNGPSDRSFLNREMRSLSNRSFVY